MIYNRKKKTQLQIVNTIHDKVLRMQIALALYYYCVLILPSSNKIILRGNRGTDCYFFPPQECSLSGPTSLNGFTEFLRIMRNQGWLVVAHFPHTEMKDPKRA